MDFARKLVGVASVGTEAFMVLLMGDRDDGPLFLLVKEPSASVLAPQDVGPPPRPANIDSCPPRDWVASTRLSLQGAGMDNLVRNYP